MLKIQYYAHYKNMEDKFGVFTFNGTKEEFIEHVPNGLYYENTVFGYYDGNHFLFIFAEVGE